MYFTALSLQQPWASMIADGEKTIETRIWSTSYRGQVLICATKKPVLEGLPSGCAMALADLVDVRRMEKEDEVEACCEWEWGRFAWLLENIQPTNNIPVRGMQRLFSVELDWDELFNETEKGDEHE